MPEIMEFIIKIDFIVNKIQEKKMCILLQEKLE
jgi:hypothetical protein